MNPRLEKILKLPAHQRLLLLAGAVLLLAGGFAYFLYLPKHEELTSLRQRNDQLQAKLLQDRRIAADLPKFKAEYEKMNEQLNKALTELPNEKEIPTLLTNIASLAKGSGLDVLRFKPGAEAPKGFYAEVPVELKLSGSYHQAGMFFSSVAGLPRIVNINNLTMGSGKTAEGATALSVECLATTFRFLEEGEKKEEVAKK